MFIQDGKPGLAVGFSRMNITGPADRRNRMPLAAFVVLTRHVSRVLFAKHIMRTKHFIQFLAALAISGGAAFAQYPAWQHSGSIFVLTTPDGADLPAAAVVEDFPLLVRLNKDWFDFTQAKAGGEDVRFSTSTGATLA